MSQAQLDPTMKHNKETTGEFGKKKKKNETTGEQGHWWKCHI